MTDEPDRRLRLYNRRAAYTFELQFAGEKYFVTTGFYDLEMTKLGEVFVQRIRDKAAARLGPHLDATARDAAVMLSFALQYGAPLDTIARALSMNEEGEPESLFGAIIREIQALQSK